MIRVGIAVILAITCFEVRAADNHRCAEDLARRLLEAIRDRDAKELRSIGNNPGVFDDETAIGYLIAGKDFRFFRREDLKSAYGVLAGAEVMTKVTVTEGPDDTKAIDVVYLPRTTAANFDELAIRITRGQSVAFRDYVMCRFEVRGRRVWMPHACHAETDALE